jgi:CheY-like chemotaxis protein
MTKTEVHCPECGGAWTIDKPRAGEMLCPRCMTRIPLTGSVVRGAVPRPAAPVPPAAESAPAPTAPAAGEAAVPVGAPPAGGPVVCPRCQLHFVPRSATEPPASGRPTILVVDDLAYFRQLAADALEPTFAVRTAATSAEAREFLAAGGIDLLVLDLTLDGCNAGRDLLAELTPKPCPILIFTAQDESMMYGEPWEELQRLGADDVVIKGMKVAESLARKASALLRVTADERPRGG